MTAEGGEMGCTKPAGSRPQGRGRGLDGAGTGPGPQGGLRLLTFAGLFLFPWVRGSQDCADSPARSSHTWPPGAWSGGHLWHSLLSLWGCLLLGQPFLQSLLRLYLDGGCQASICRPLTCEGMSLRHHWVGPWRVLLHPAGWSSSPQVGTEAWVPAQTLTLESRHTLSQ